MKIKALIDVKVECSPPTVYRWGKTLAEQVDYEARQLDAWAREFNDFIRDHRSQDQVRVSIERVYEDQCSHCHETWELCDDGLPGCCDKAIAESESGKA